MKILMNANFRALLFLLRSLRRNAPKKIHKRTYYILTIEDFIFAAFMPHFQQNITGIRDIHIININANYLLMPIERFVASHRRGSEF